MYVYSLLNSFIYIFEYSIYLRLIIHIQIFLFRIFSNESPICRNNLLDSKVSSMVDLIGLSKAFEIGISLGCPSNNNTDSVIALAATLQVCFSLFIVFVFCSFIHLFILFIIWHINAYIYLLDDFWLVQRSAKQSNGTFCSNRPLFTS